MPMTTLVVRKADRATTLKANRELQRSAACFSICASIRRRSSAATVRCSPSAILRSRSAVSRSRRTLKVTRLGFDCFTVHHSVSFGGMLLRHIYTNGGRDV